MGVRFRACESSRQEATTPTAVLLSSAPQGHRGFAYSSGGPARLRLGSFGCQGDLSAPWGPFSNLVGKRPGARHPRIHRSGMCTVFSIGATTATAPNNVGFNGKFAAFVRTSRPLVPVAER
jgi:hypothetical protein